MNINETAVLFYKGNEVETLKVTLMREFDMTEKQAEKEIKKWAKKRGYKIIDVKCVVQLCEP